MIVVVGSLHDAGGESLTGNGLAASGDGGVSRIQGVGQPRSSGKGYMHRVGPGCIFQQVRAHEWQHRVQCAPAHGVARDLLHRGPCNLFQ